MLSKIKSRIDICGTTHKISFPRAIFRALNSSDSVKDGGSRIYTCSLATDRS